MSDEEHLQQQGRDDQQKRDKNNDNANRIKENKFSFQLNHRVFRPMTMSNQRVPMMFVSGRPSMPQKCLLGLVNHMPCRKIAFCD